MLAMDRAEFDEAVLRRWRATTGVTFGSAGTHGSMYGGVLNRLFPTVESYTTWQRHLTRVGGVSAGALVGLMVTLGWTPDAMLELVRRFPTVTVLLRDVAALESVHQIVDGSIRGLMHGLSLQFIVHTILREHGLPEGTTLGELGRLRRPDFELRILATDVAARQLVTFSTSATPDVPVAIAVAASATIPVLFRPVRWGDMVLIDGGVFDSAGCSLFPDDGTILHVVKLNDAGLPRDDIAYVVNAIAIMAGTKRFEHQENVIVTHGPTFDSVNLFKEPDVDALARAGEEGVRRTLDTQWVVARLAGAVTAGGGERPPA